MRYSILYLSCQLLDGTICKYIVSFRSFFLRFRAKCLTRTRRHDRPVRVNRRELRLSALLELIKSRDRVSIQEMVDHLGVSAVTVRKDLEKLAQRGDVLRTFGGAVLTRGAELDPTIQERTRLHEREKRLIGASAAQLIQPGENIIIDAGSTTLMMVQHLRGIGSLHVITAALNVALEAGSLPLVTVIVPGTGMLDPITMSLEGPEVEEAYGRLHADKYFMGLRGVDLQHGFMDTNIRRIRLKQSMIRAARQTIALADSSKLGRSSLVQIAPLGSISSLVTDGGASPTILDQLRGAGLQVIVADAHGASAPEYNPAVAAPHLTGL